MWQIILLIIIFLIIVPIFVRVKLSFNVLRLSGEVCVKVLFINYKVRVRFRGQYVYVTRNGKTRREKLTAKNYNIAYILQLVRQIYFRVVLSRISFTSEEGYYNDAMYTAIGSGIIDIASKSLFARILHNKKSAHIFVLNEPKYNQDCLNVKVEGEACISIFDVGYSIVNSHLSLKGEKYERNKAEYEQNQGVD